ncbi:MAG TPA: ATP-binding protein, partial [Burkholderiales bacterium]|nr:ATP-binding protein [Burkholderiales bacterium]
RVLDVNDVVTGLDKMLRRLIGEDIELVTALDRGVGPVKADPAQLEQVVMNLAKNAVEAMGVGERRELTVITSRSNGQTRVSVTDTGPGVTPALREKLFAPFFTTKPEGMGMGLNICRSIVEYHQGRLWIEPNPGGGSVFSFTLPV